MDIRKRIDELNRNENIPRSLEARDELIRAYSLALELTDWIDDYLNRGETTVLKSIEKDEYPSFILEMITIQEEKMKKRPKVLKKLQEKRITSEKR